MNKRIFRGGRFLALAALLALLVQGRATATPLNLVSGTPDITASGLDFTYDSGGGVCGGALYTLCYNADPAFISSYGLTPEIVDFVPYMLVAGIDPLTGELTAAGGTFTMGGYLTGTVSAFGYSLAGGVAVLEFLIDINGGTLAASFGPTLGIIGTVWNWGDLDFGPSLTTVASTGGVEMTDNFGIVAEPATLSLLGLGLFAASAIRRRHYRRARGL